MVRWGEKEGERVSCDCWVGGGASNVGDTKLKVHVIPGNTMPENQSGIEDASPGSRVQSSRGLFRGVLLLLLGVLW